MKPAKHWSGLLLLLVVLAAAPLAAQLQTGNLYGTVTDASGSPIPGVTVTLAGQGAPQIQVSNAQGQVRFLGLSPGSDYSLKAELEGFSTLEYPKLAINVGRNANIEMKLTSAVEDVITVTTEGPLLDERRISTGANVGKDELEKIPTGRDPWVILQSTPGVLLDRVNVGGSEGGQQSTYVGPGSTSTNAVWSVDGVVITDMAALGSSPTYYDFDAFEEMQVSTGGSDTTLATAGVSLNMVTKRGTNEWRGSGRYLGTKSAWQSDSSIGAGDFGKPGAWNTISRTVNAVTGQVRDPGGAHAQAAFKRGNRIDDIKDYGAELGGPLMRDRLWIWGSYSRQKIGLLTVSDVSDHTDLEDKSGKLNGQITPSNSATGFYFNGNKEKQGRGAGPTRPQETTWNQTGPTNIYKVEDTHIFNSSLYLTGLYAYAKNVFSLTPQGGLDATAYLDEGSVWHNTFVFYDTIRPQHQYRLDGSSFFNTGNVAHELKFGAGYRTTTISSISRWGGLGLTYNGPTFFGTSDNVLAVARDAITKNRLNYSTGYVQDTLTVGNLTANVGLRYDKQAGEILPETARANPVLPNLLPSSSFKGGDIGFSWNDLTPRLGLTYALGAERKTLLRGSYSRFADQLGGTLPVRLNPLALNSYAYVYTTNPGTGNITPGQLGDLLFFSGNTNPFTGKAIQINKVDPDLHAPTTDELLFGVEHALRPEFVVGLNLTYRKLGDLVQNDLLVFDDTDPYSAANIGSAGRVARTSDYVQVTATTRNVTLCDNADCSLRRTQAVPLLTPDGKPYTLQYYQLAGNLSTRTGVFTHNGDLEQTYKGASLTFNKRLANRWMMRGNFTVSDWKWTKVRGVADPTLTLGPGNRDGDQVLQGSLTGAGSRGGVYINSKWSYSLNGMYQVAPDRPWGFNVAGNLTGRQGYPIPYFQRVGLPANEQFAFDYVQVNPTTDTYRNPDLRVLDARIEKELNFNDFGLTLGLDVFNLTNESTVLQRQQRLAVATSNFVTEVLSPRVFRLGARFSFR